MRKTCLPAGRDAQEKSFSHGPYSSNLRKCKAEHSAFISFEWHEVGYMTLFQVFTQVEQEDEDKMEKGAWVAKRAEPFGFALIFSLLLSFASRQKKVRMFKITTAAFHPSLIS